MKRRATAAAFMVAALLFMVPIARGTQEETRWHAMEFNFLDSGNGMILVCDQPVCSETIGPDHRRRSFMRYELVHDLIWPYSELWIRIHSSSNDVKYPNSVGMEAALLSPLRFWNDRVLAGLYHHSQHNLSVAENGNGSDTTGIQLKWKPQNSYVSEVWINGFDFGDFFQSKETPYVFTRSAAPGTLRSELGTLEWEVNISRSVKRGVDYRVRVMADAKGLASFHNRIEWWTSPSFAAYAEWNMNLQKQNLFGRDEWLVGPRSEYRF